MFVRSEPAEMLLNLDDAAFRFPRLSMIQALL